MADLVIRIATPVLVLALLDPLEGGVLVALLAIPVSIAGFVLRRRARWLVVAGLALAVLTFGLMAVAGEVAAVLQNATIWPWLVAVLTMVAGSVGLLRASIAARRPELATFVTYLLALLIVGMTLRVVLLLREYQPWDRPMTVAATAAREDVRLDLLLDDNELIANEAKWGAVELVNAGAIPVTLPPATILNLVMRGADGTVLWDAADRYYGPVPRSWPWERAEVLAPGESSHREWMLACFAAGSYEVTAEVVGGPYDGLATEPITIECSPPPVPRD
jgi:hypothetical protein